MPGAPYLLRLHFAEIYWTSAGSRVFNVSVNGSQALQSFDIFAAAGGANKAVVNELTASADGSGRIAVGFQSVVDSAKLSGLEVLSSSGGTAFR